MRSVLSPLLAALLMLMSACISCKQSGSTKENYSTQQSSEIRDKKNVYFVSPQKNQRFNNNAQVFIKLALRDTSRHPDSVLILIDNKKLASISSFEDSICWPLRNSRLGSRNVEAVCYYHDGQKDHTFIQVTLLSGTLPVQYSYKVINTYPHSRNSYTQGLVYDKELLYESTGIYGQSKLQKIKYQTGAVLNVFNLPNDIFGEGIALFDNKIIQISWKEQVAFLYDKETFEQINKIYYPIKEGWGITYNGTHLIMSDGSHILYILDKEYFTELSRIEVFDQKGPVPDLNELEYIQGEIWANIYNTNTIVRINPTTGEVVGKIDMTGLLKPEDKTNTTSVLNGIAYDPATGRIFVTGKNWPKLFEISLVPNK